MNYIKVLGPEFGGPDIRAWPTEVGDRLRPHKGGGGGNDAARIEQERRERAQLAIDAINGVFDNANRDALYKDHRNAVYSLNTKEVERQAADMERLNRFALARNGLLGGSADVDASAEINRRTNEGLAQAGGIADAAMADLQAADEGTRSSLVSMAQAGTDATTAAQLANQQLKENMDTASADKAVASVGDLFGSMANAYLYQNLSKYAQSLQPVAPSVTSTKKDRSGNAPQNTYQGQ